MCTTRQWSAWFPLGLDIIASGPYSTILLSWVSFSCRFAVAYSTRQWSAWFWFGFDLSGPPRGRAFLPLFYHFYYHGWVFLAVLLSHVVHGNNLLDFPLAWILLPLKRQGIFALILPFLLSRVSFSCRFAVAYSTRQWSAWFWFGLDLSGPQRGRAFLPLFYHFYYHGWVFLAALLSRIVRGNDLLDFGLVWIWVAHHEVGEHVAPARQASGLQLSHFCHCSRSSKTEPQIIWVLLYKIYVWEKWNLPFCYNFRQTRNL